MSDIKDSELVALEELRNGLEDISEGLGKLNDMYPATQVFLKAKGVSSVNDLDKEGMRELRIHLEDTLKLILVKSK